jgi:hypothetical protein
VLVPALARAAVRRRAGQDAALAITALNGATSVSHEPPRTPWGDPDLQGTWTSDDMRGVPTVRPQQFGDQLYLTDQEFADRSKRDEQTRNRADNDIGSFRNDVGTRTWRQTSLIVDPANGRYPAFTPYAETRRASRDRGTFGDGPFDTFEDFTLYDRCITRGIVGGVLPVPYGNGNTIVQAPGMVIISYEMVHDTRIVYTDGRRTSAAACANTGDSRGAGRQHAGDRDGQLTTRPASVPTATDRADLKMTERITRVGADIVQYEVTVNDPKTYVAPFTISMPLTPLRGEMLLPYECHEGNYGLKNALSAERTEDRAIAEDLAKGVTRPRRAIQVNVPNRPEAPQVEGIEKGFRLQASGGIHEEGTPSSRAPAAMCAATRAGRTQRAAAPPLVITAYNDGAPIPYTTPRTPWGDPDLQGVWSSDDTAGIPRERPANLGNRLYQTDEEWAARQKQVSDGVRRGENAVGSFRNDTPRAFRQTSLIVDPPTAVSRRSRLRPRSAATARSAPSATDRSTPSRISRSTTATSRAASSARSSASSTATATASCRRRAWWRSATR